MRKKSTMEICVYCGGKTNDNFKMMGLTIICPHCDKPQPNGDEEE